jgi:hypothetical protein
VKAGVRGLAAPADRVGVGTGDAAGALRGVPRATPLTDLPAGTHAAGTDPESAGREPTGVAVGDAAAVETATACRTRASGAARLTRTAAGEADVIHSVGPADRVGRALRRGRTAAAAGSAAARAGDVGGAGASAGVSRADGAGVGSDAARLGIAAHLARTAARGTDKRPIAGDRGIRARAVRATR